MTTIGIASRPLSEADHNTQLRRAVIASTVGTTIEWSLRTQGAALIDLVIVTSTSDAPKRTPPRSSLVTQHRGKSLMSGMPDSWKPIRSMFCKQYQTEVQFYIDEAHASGKRHLVARYEKPPENLFGRDTFMAGIPDNWREEDVIDLIFWPMKDDSNAPYPAWEVPARAYNSPTRFRWWAGEKPQ